MRRLLVAGLVLSGFGAMAPAAAEQPAGHGDRPCAKTGTYVKPNGDLARNTSRANPGQLFADRADERDEDQERQLGQTANLGGYTVTVIGGEFVPSLSDTEQAGYLKVAIRVCNRNDEAQDVNPFFDWKLQTPAGTLIDPAITSATTLPAVGLVQSGEVAGDLYFAVGDERGDFYVIYQPVSKLFDESRGLWMQTI